MKVSAHCEHFKGIRPSVHISINVNLDTDLCTNITICSVCKIPTKRTYVLTPKQGFNIFEQV